MASLYKREKHFWISYTLNGQRVQESLDTDNERIARDKKRRIEYELAIGDLQMVSRLPLPTIVEEFCRNLKIRSPHKSCSNDLSRLRRFFGPICESLQLGKLSSQAKQRWQTHYGHAHVKVELLEDITPEMISRFVSARMREDQWSPKTANSLRKILHRLFAFAIKHHRVCSRDRRNLNPAAAVERYREHAPEIRFLTLEQIATQLNAVRDPPTMHALVATYIYAGLRREEALWLTHEDVDFERRVIRVRAKTIDGKNWQPKTKCNRAVPISEVLLGILMAYRSPHGCVWFFPSPAGKQWNPDNFSQDLQRTNAAAGLDWTCLDFRHTFGSQLAQKGESLYKIATLMGNSPAICQRHYAALIPEAMHDTVEFPTEAAVGAGNSNTNAMLQEVLRQLNELKGQGQREPTLKLVTAGDAD